MTDHENWPDANTLIPDLIEAAPQARTVLDRYGLRGCGGPLGPRETLGFFARAHEVPIVPLLQEIRAGIASSESPASNPSSSASVSSEGLKILDADKPRAADTIYRPFFKSGIVMVLSLGAVWGAYLLLRIALTGKFAAAGLHDVNAHGHAQIFGWVGLFVMGFAYQAFPRFKHSALAWPRLAFATLWMMLIGLVVRSLAEPAAASIPWAYWPAVSAAALETVAIAMFVAIICETWRRSGRRLEFYDEYILCAMFWFVVQAIYEGIYLAATLSTEGDRLVALVSRWQPALRDIQIHGFALLMILGVSQRIFHHFYGLPRPNPKLSRIMLVLLNAAIVGEVAGLVLMQSANHAWAGLWYASILVLGGAIVALVSNWGIFGHTDEGDRSLKFLRAAYVWLFVSLAMLVAFPLYQFVILPFSVPDSEAVGMGFSHAYYGAIRHAITVGFVSLMIVGVASKVVPTLNGLSSKSLSPLWGPFLLLNFGCSLRVGGQITTDFTAGAFPLAGMSGVLEVAGLAAWGVHLWSIMSGRARLRTEQSPEETAHPLNANLPIQSRHTVGAVLERHPELLDVFVEHGFTMLANPQLRRTIARVVTIEKACKRMEVNSSDFLAALEARRRHSESDSHCASTDIVHDGPGEEPTMIASMVEVQHDCCKREVRSSR